MSFQETILKPERPDEGCPTCGGKVSVYIDNADNYLYQCLEVNCRSVLNCVDGESEERVMDADEFSRLVCSVVEGIEEE